MSDELGAAIRTLQVGEEATAQQAFAAIADSVWREPEDGAAALQQAVLAEAAAGGLRTPRLLTLLGLAPAPAPACLPVCLALLRAAADPADPAHPAEPPPGDALLGAAAIVARTQPGALLPDLAAVKADPQAAQATLGGVAQALLRLLAISSHVLRALPDHAVADMVRGLWRDCAAFDLMTLADFVGLRLEATGADDPLVALMVDLIDRLPASADHKRYAGQRLAQAGVGAAVVERLQSAWRAIRVVPVPVPGSALHAAQDPEPPPSEPRVDEWLVAFAEGDEHGIELARVVIDEMFEASPSPPGLAWWTVATVDAVPPRRRRRDIAWVLIHLGTLLRKQHGCAPPVSPSTLMRWLDTPQLLDATGTRIALELLARLQPALVLQRCLHRAVSASDEALPTAYHAALMVGGLWRALVAAEPAVVLQLVSRWLAFGFGAVVFVECLLQLLAERGLQQPGLVDTLAASLVPSASLPPEVIDVAHQLLDNLHQLPPPEPPP